VVVKPYLIIVALLVSCGSTTAPVSNKIDCVPITNSASALSTGEMTDLLSTFADYWNPNANDSVAGLGAMGRLFSGAGRAMHPKEIADIISKSPDFKGPKKTGVWLGVSDSAMNDSSSYAAQLANLLGVSVVGCDADFYLLNNGMGICAAEPKYDRTLPSGLGRSMPSGFTISGAFSDFCKAKGMMVDPKIVVSTAAAFGLYDDEIQKLKVSASNDPKAAFRLYQYYWLSTRNPKSAMIWLKKAAALGLPVAKFNLAYELFETDEAENISEAKALSAELAVEGFKAPDLRKFYVGK
jgi:TPR repeat protein